MYMCVLVCGVCTLACVHHVCTCKRVCLCTCMHACMFVCVYVSVDCQLVQRNDPVLDHVQM